MKTHKIQYLFFTCFLTIGASSLVISNSMMQLYPKNGYLLYLFLLPFILLITYLAPISKDSLKQVTTHPFLRFIFILYQVITNFILIIVYLQIANDFYYNMTSPVVIFAVVLLAAVFLSAYGVRNIFHLGFVISVICTILVFSLLLIHTKGDFNLIKTNNISLNHYLPLVGYLFIFFDILLLPIFLPYNKITKTNLQVVMIIAVIINTFLILQNYLLFDYHFFLRIRYPYIVKYFVFSNNLHFQHLDLLFFIFITIYLFFRLSLNIEFTRIIIRIRRQSPLIIMFPLIMFLLILLGKDLLISSKNFNYLMIICSFLAFMFFSYLKFLIMRRKNGKTS